jgi:hypothetical protein
MWQSLCVSVWNNVDLTIVIRGLYFDLLLFVKDWQGQVYDI